MSSPKTTWWSWERAAGVVALVTLGLAAAFFFPPLQYHPEGVRYSGDATSTCLPYYLRVFTPIEATVAGAWDPTILTGLPQSHLPYGCFYPPTVVLYSLLPPAIALTLGGWLHYALAAWGAYLLARQFGLGRGASFFAAIPYSFGGLMFFHFGHITIHQPGAWLPWILLLLERYRRGGGLVYPAAAGTLIGMQALAGHPQFVLLGAGVWILHAVYFSWFACTTWPQRRRLLGGTAAACLLGALLSLPQFLPLLEVAQWSRYGDFDSQFLTDGSLPWQGLVGFAGPYILGAGYGVPAAPRYLGHSEHGLFLGVAPLLLAILGVVGFVHLARGSLASPTEASHPPAPSPVPLVEVGFWVMLAMLYTLLMLGANTPLYKVVAWIPVYRLFHMPARHLWVAGLAWSWLAGFGLELISRAAPAQLARWWRTAAVAVAGILVVVVAAVLSLNWKTGPGLTYPGFWLPLLSALGFLSLLGALVRWPRERAVFALLLALITFGELYGSLVSLEVRTRLEPLVARDHFPAAVHWLRAQSQEGMPTRCTLDHGYWSLDGQLYAMPGGFSSAWGISSLNYYMQAAPASLRRLLRLSEHGFADFASQLGEERGLSAAAGQFIVTDRPLPTRAAGLGFRARDLRHFVWKTEGSRTRHKQAIGRELSGKTRLACNALHFVEGIATVADPHDPLTVRVTTRRGELLAETVVPAEPTSPQRSFALRLTTDPVEDWIRVGLSSEGEVQVEQLDIWRLDSTPGSEAVTLTPAQLVQRLRQPHRDSAQPYPLVATFADGVKIYANPQARPFASLVEYVRPAASDREAVDGQLNATDRPVRQVAYVTAPGHLSHDLSLNGESRFAAGVAHVVDYHADDLTVQTQTKGPGFLVLAQTRCRGWVATVDGHETPLHAVDGALMGVTVPPGTHEVRLTYTPVLARAGLFIAGAALLGAWLLAWGWRPRSRPATGVSPTTVTFPPAQAA